MILASLRNRTAERRGRQNVCVWQTWQAYYLCLLSWSSLKLTSRLSHKVWRLLSSPVLLRTFTTIITRQNKKKGKVQLTIYENENRTEIKYFRQQRQQRLWGFLSVNNLSKSYSTQQQSCSVRFNTANDEQCGSHLMVFDKTANYSLPRSRFGLVTQRSSFGRSVAWRDKNRLWGRLR